MAATAFSSLSLHKPASFQASLSQLLSKADPTIQLPLLQSLLSTLKDAAQKMHAYRALVGLKGARAVEWVAVQRGLIAQQVIALEVSRRERLEFLGGLGGDSELLGVFVQTLNWGEHTDGSLVELFKRILNQPSLHPLFALSHASIAIARLQKVDQPLWKLLTDCLHGRGKDYYGQPSLIQKIDQK
jgi:hypothetical protein